MTREELAIYVAKIKAEMVQRASEGDGEARRWLVEVYPEEFGQAKTQAVNKPVPAHWQEREPGEEG